MIMRTMRRYIVLAVTVLFSAIGFMAGAQTLPSLTLQQDPSVLSMGMAGVSADAGAYAIQNNVAAISLTDKTMDVQVGLGLWQPSYADLMTIGVGGIYRLGKLGFGLDFKMLRMPPYGSVSGNGSDIRDSEFSPGEMGIAAGFSYAIIDCLSAGVTLRYADSKLAEEASAAVFGADIAVYFEKNGITAGLSLNNLGTKVKYAETSYSQPMMLKLGAGYDLKLGTSALDFDAEADVLFAGGVMVGAGCEYSFKDMVFARAGYHFGSSANAVPSYASAGLGLKFFGAQLNFAYLFGSDVLSSSLCVSLGYTF